MDLTVLGKAAKAASFQLATASTAQKNQALASMADQLEAQSASILLQTQKILRWGAKRVCLMPCWIACCSMSLACKQSPTMCVT